MYHFSFSRSIRTGITGIFILLFISVSDAQTAKSVEQLKQQANQMSEMLQKQKDSLNKASIDRINDNSYNWILQYQKEQKAKQRKKAILYMVMGGAMLAVLVYGLSRKKKKS
jgi:flagellar biosynthesis protein FliP